MSMVIKNEIRKEEMSVAPLFADIRSQRATVQISFRKCIRDSGRRAKGSNEITDSWPPGDKRRWTMSRLISPGLIGTRLNTTES